MHAKPNDELTPKAAAQAVELYIAHVEKSLSNSVTVDNADKTADTGVAAKLPAPRKKCCFALRR